MGLFFKIANLLNEAATSNQDLAILTNLKEVQELVLRKNPALLDNFLDVSNLIYKRAT
jgi:symplekin